MGRNDCDECDKNYYDVITNEDEPRLLCFSCYNLESGVSQKQKEMKLNSNSGKGRLRQFNNALAS